MYLCSLQVFVVVVVVNWLSSFSLIFRIYDLAYSPDGNQLLAAAGSNILVCPLCPPSFIYIYYNYYIIIQVCNGETGKLEKPLRGHKDNVHSLCYNREGSLSNGGQISKWFPSLLPLQRY